MTKDRDDVWVWLDEAAGGPVRAEFKATAPRPVDGFALWHCPWPKDHAPSGVPKTARATELALLRARIEALEAENEDLRRERAEALDRIAQIKAKLDDLPSAVADSFEKARAEGLARFGFSASRGEPGAKPGPGE